MSEFRHGGVIEEGFWCEREGIYFTDADEHPDWCVGVPEDVFEHIEDEGHFGYACLGAALPRLQVLIVAAGHGDGMFPPIRQPVTRDDHGRKGETGEMRCCKLKDLHRHPVTCNNPATVVIWVMVKGTVTLVTLCQECLP